MGGWLIVFWVSIRVPFVLVESVFCCSGLITPLCVPCTVACIRVMLSPAASSLASSQAALQLGVLFKNVKVRQGGEGPVAW